MREIIDADAFARRLGIELLALGPGYSKMAMRVTDDMVNFHGTTHGAAIFALADAAFAAAGNSRGRMSLALHVAINYLAATEPGETLYAEAREEYVGRRTALYRLTVTDARGHLIASCQALAYQKNEWWTEPSSKG